MIGLRKLYVDERAASAVEMALALPLLLVLIWGPLEIGNYFMNEHILIKGVRDGATYAAHQDITRFNCVNGAIDPNLKTETQNIIRTGDRTGGIDRLRNWGWGLPWFDMTLSCVTQSDDGTTTLGGIYALNGGQVPVITITAAVPYSPILGNLGFRPPALSMTATQEATVMGI